MVKSKTYTSSTIMGLVTTILILMALLSVICFYITPNTKQAHRQNTKTLDNGSCSKDTCGAIDDVNNPVYNMKNIVKQSILLEEHIAEPNKYCLSCIVKHFQHIIGLAEEAIWLAGVDVSKYPLLDSSVNFYQSTFDKWLSNKTDDANKKEVLSALRERRRQLVDIYFLG